MNFKCLLQIGRTICTNSAIVEDCIGSWCIMKHCLNANRFLYQFKVRTYFITHVKSSHFLYYFFSHYKALMRRHIPFHTSRFYRLYFLLLFPLFPNNITIYDLIQTHVSLKQFNKCIWQHLIISPEIINPFPFCHLPSLIKGVIDTFVRFGDISETGISFNI